MSVPLRDLLSAYFIALNYHDHFLPLFRVVILQLDHLSP
jgi:hypothetical protein